MHGTGHGRSPDRPAAMLFRQLASVTAIQAEPVDARPVRLPSPSPPCRSAGTHRNRFDADQRSRFQDEFASSHARGSGMIAGSAILPLSARRSGSDMRATSMRLSPGFQGPSLSISHARGSGMMPIEERHARFHLRPIELVTTCSNPGRAARPPPRVLLPVGLRPRPASSVDLRGRHHPSAAVAISAEAAAIAPPRRRDRQAGVERRSILSGVAVRLTPGLDPAPASARPRGSPTISTNGSGCRSADVLIPRPSRKQMPRVTRSYQTKPPAGAVASIGRRPDSAAASATMARGPGAVRPISMASRTSR